MRADFRWKLGLVLGLTLISAVILFPPLTAGLTKDGLGILGGQPIRLGLDLRGGLEIILGPDYRVDPETLAWVENRIEDALEQWTDPAGIAMPAISKLGLEELGKYEGLRLRFASESEAQRVLAAKVIQNELTMKQSQRDVRLVLQTVQAGRDLEVRVEQPVEDLEASLASARTILENRVNSLGLSEPDIRLDREHHRIYVQLPGVTSEEKAREILQHTGRLNFRINGRKVMYGDDLKNAEAQYQNGELVIRFSFGSKGAARLRFLTQQNLKKPMEIYLDEEPLMANPGPIIEDVIPDGDGIIRLGRGSNMEQARTYAILMKSGALPVSLRNLAVNQVAPTLGKEIVRQSLVAGVAGIVLVVAFMVIFYGLVGALADAALVLYAALVLVVMALLRGVLTLPGVAGLILSIGMAVDANIIIFERIKDEIRLGKRVRPAIEAGFKRAFLTIFDGNVTTLLIAGVLLFYPLGSGAIRGFAVTLTIGILVSMFTALVVTRYFLEMLTDRDPDRFVSHFGA
ncbi:MAG: protein translocase subunit SecD [Patescibacteria group bacterium]